MKYGILKNPKIRQGFKFRVKALQVPGSKNLLKFQNTSQNSSEIWHKFST